MRFSKIGKWIFSVCCFVLSAALVAMGVAFVWTGNLESLAILGFLSSICSAAMLVSVVGLAHLPDGNGNGGNQDGRD